MRYFICALEGIQVGIPAERTERIIPAGRVQTAVSETENQDTFISLPALFQLKNIAAPHGVVLKPESAKTVLLTPKIDIELEIPEENIHRLPDAFAGQYRYFRGACFNGPNVIFLLDPEKLGESV